MHLHFYAIVVADGLQEAIDDVRGHIEDNSRPFDGGGWYPWDYGEVIDEDVKILNKELMDSLRKSREENYQERMSYFESNIQRYADNPKELGLFLMYKGRLLTQELCSDMPFFNFWDWSYSLPDELQESPEKTDTSNWYAVRCDVHY